MARYKKTDEETVEIKGFDPRPSARFAKLAMAKLALPAAVIGRFAIWAWVNDESQHAYTKDLDLAVPVNFRMDIFKWLNDQKMKVRPLPIGGAKAQDGKGVNVDFIDRVGELGDLGGLFEGAIDRALDSPKKVKIAGVILPLAPAEYLLVMKIATGEKKDEEDAVRLILYCPRLKIDLARKLAAQYAGPAAVGKLEALLRENNHPKAHPRKKYS